MTATPPASLANLSCSFSLSKSEVVSSIWLLTWVILSFIALESPLPFTITVLSLVTLTLSAFPNISIVVSFKSIPNSSEITLPPVSIAISWSISFLLSPNPGAFTPTQVNVPLNLLTTNVAIASPSISSAIINSFFPDWTICSSIGGISCMLEIFLSVINIYGLSRLASIFSISVDI